ncbi:hypothetical protein [uncultured Tateyamaria sp.]|uniref:hypothetical protein n=1 Tax=uncultured Tateyamaria sp. TaxID=455651 RepID=UPI00261E0D3B|nr:hypothetical protein [uncultured Tateyamaria sp.]
MTPKRPSDENVDAWLDEALGELGRTPVGAPSDDLMSRVLGDAMSEMPAPGGPAPLRSALRQILQGLGGWPALGGLAAAAATGFIVGLGALGTSADAMAWPFGYDALYQDQSGLDAFGWDFEEG